MINNLFTLETISLLSTIIINLVLIIVICLIKNKSKNNYYFLVFISFILIWTVSTLSFLMLPERMAFISAKIFYISGCIIPVSIILFTKTFPKERLNYSKLKLAIFLAIPSLICVSVLIPNAVIKDIVINTDYRSIIFGPAYYTLFLYIASYFSIAFIVMFKKHRELVGVEKKQVQIIFSSICFASILALAVSLIMPTLGKFGLFWAGPFFSGYMLLTITYSIIRYGFFDIKLVSTEFLTLATWMLLLVKIFFDRTNADRVIDSVVLVLIIISGILIIKAVQRETVLREKDDKLVSNITGLNQILEKTNIDLKALDKKKSEFMSLATHQLRAPLTAMKGYSSMILDGTFGKVNNPEVEDAIVKISRSTTDLTMIVEDYLNISQIEQGRMQYNFSIFDLPVLLKEVIAGVKNMADRIGLVVTLNYDTATTYRVNVDEGKIKQVFLNVIDNAIKYTQAGHIDIYISKVENNKVLVKVQDTGVGIELDVLPTLFHKFVRAPEASKINILGTGLGLYVAGEILKAHNGNAWAESDGKGKGSRFYIQLDLA